MSNFYNMDEILTGESAGDESEVEQVTGFLGTTLALIKAAEKIHFTRPKTNTKTNCIFSGIVLVWTTGKF